MSATDASGLLLVMQSATPGREKEHLDWYVSTHLPDVCGVAGTIRGEFTGAVSVGTDGAPPRWNNAALYWLKRDAVDYVREVMERGQSGEWHLADTIDMTKLLMLTGEAITPRLQSSVTADVPPKDRLLFIVLTNATPGDDEAFNNWYSDTHIPDVLDVPGFVAAQRFRLIDHPMLPSPPYRYAALYEVRKMDAEAAFAELNARAGTERMPLSPTLDNDVHAVPFAPEGVIDATA